MTVSPEGAAGLVGRPIAARLPVISSVIYVMSKRRPHPDRSDASVTTSPTPCDSAERPHPPAGPRGTPAPPAPAAGPLDRSAIGAAGPLDRSAIGPPKKRKSTRNEAGDTA